MGLYSNILASSPNKQPSPKQQTGLFQRLLDIIPTAISAVTDPVGTATRAAIQHPKETADIAKKVAPIAVSVAQSIPRAGGSIGLELRKGLGIEDPYGTGNTQFDSNNIENPTFRKAFQTIFGKEPVKDFTGEGGSTLKGFGITDKNKPLNFAVGGALALSNFAGGEGDIAKVLSKTSDLGKVGEILKAANVADDVIKEVAPTIAATKDSAKVGALLKGAIADSKEASKIKDAAQADSQTATVGPKVLDLRKNVAASATEPPVKTGFEAAKDVITPPKPIAVGSEITPLDRGGQNIAQRLTDARDKLLSGIPEAPGAIKARLTNPENVIKEANKPTYLNNLRPSADVAGDFLGTHGSNMVYKLAEGADKERQVIDSVLPQTDKIKEIVYGGKLKAGLAKTKAGQIELSKPIVAALNDRANADQIIAKASENSPKIKELWDNVVGVFDNIAKVRQDRGLPVRNDYSPRALLKDGQDTADGLLHQLTSAFNPDVTSPFSKARKIEDNVAVNPNIFEVLPGYVSSQAKELGYTDAAKFIKDNITKVDPTYLTNSHNYQTGVKYMQNLVEDLINPAKTSKVENFANKLINLKYKSDLTFALKSSLQNRTQKWFANSYVSKDAQKLAKALNPEDAALIDNAVIGKDLGISGEASNAAAKESKLSKIDPFVRSEKGNVKYASRAGAMEAVVRSTPYQEALKQGLSKSDAIGVALKDPETLQAAIKRSNIVSNATQFNGNKALKPEAFREGGNLFGIPLSWLKQYRTYQVGMTRNLYEGLIATGKTRELDIIKNGDPREVGLVNFARAARSVDNYLGDLEKAAKNGEVPDLTAKEVSSYRSQLGSHIKELNKLVADASPISRGKVAKNLAKAWGVAFGIQLLFDGALFDVSQYPKEFLRSSPGNIPTRSEDVTNPKPPILRDKPGYLIPIVGPAAKRAKEVGKVLSNFDPNK